MPSHLVSPPQATGESPASASPTSLVGNLAALAFPGVASFDWDQRSILSSILVLIATGLVLEQVSRSGLLLVNSAWIKSSTRPPCLPYLSTP